MAIKRLATGTGVPEHRGSLAPPLRRCVILGGFPASLSVSFLEYELLTEINNLLWLKCLGESLALSSPEGKVQL